MVSSILRVRENMPSQAGTRVSLWFWQSVDGWNTLTQYQCISISDFLKKPNLNRHKFGQILNYFHFDRLKFPKCWILLEAGICCRWSSFIIHIPIQDWWIVKMRIAFLKPTNEATILYRKNHWKMKFWIWLDSLLWSNSEITEPLCMYRLSLNFASVTAWEDWDVGRLHCFCWTFLYWIATDEAIDWLNCT